MDKILITGASGFIGSNLLKFYINKGFEVINIDFKKPSDNSLLPYWKNIDITNYDKVKAAFIEFNPDFVVHLAARTDLNGKNVGDYSSNIEGTYNIISSCNLLTNLKRVIFTSSMLVCKVGYTPKNQIDYMPSTVYGKSKVKMEILIRENNLEYEWTIIRPTSIWGPNFGIPYRNFFDMIIKKWYFHIGNRSCVKTYGYVGNTIYQIDSILNAPKEDINHNVFYLGDYVPTNIEDWANEIGEEIGICIKKIPFIIIKLCAIVGDILSMIGINFPITSFRLKNMTTDNIIDLTQTEKLAPDLPYSRKEGIRDTLEWLKNQNNLESFPFKKDNLF